MYTLNNGWWFLSSGGSYPPVFTVVVYLIFLPTGIYFNNIKKLNGLHTPIQSSLQQSSKQCCLSFLSKIN